VCGVVYVLCGVVCVVCVVVHVLRFEVHVLLHLFCVIAHAMWFVVTVVCASSRRFAVLFFQTEEDKGWWFGVFPLSCHVTPPLPFPLSNPLGCIDGGERFVKGFRFGVWGLGFGVWGLGFGVWGLGFGFWVLGFGFWDLGFGFVAFFFSRHCFL